jgi:hypothetical protein
MKEIFRRKNVDTKRIKERAVLHAISSAKNEHVSPAQFARMNSHDYWGGLVSDFYEEYQKQLKENNAVQTLAVSPLLVKRAQRVRFGLYDYLGGIFGKRHARTRLGSCAVQLPHAARKQGRLYRNELFGLLQRA